jgi:arylsulfatase
MSFKEYKPGDPFPGKIGKTVEDSSQAWPVPQRARAGAPNVLFYVLDDIGYGQLKPFGGLIEAPGVERLAQNGLMYTNMHTTALCSPTRTCIMTGRNHHSNAMGTISEWSTGYPGYNSRMPLENGFMSEILKEEGYNTFAIGKWHLGVTTEETPAGPYDTWPLGRGFERFYGFMPGETDQWYPDLMYDNHAVNPPKSPEEGYHLSEDLADKAIEFIGDAHVNAPEKPFFMYYCPGAGHAPHHIFKEWADKYKGKFDMGWDKLRETIFANQKKMGIFPEETELSPRDPDVPEWDTLAEDEKKLYTRMMEVFAGFVSHADYHFGRVLEFLEEIGELDNTLIMFISDNGASPEGGVVGSLNEFNFFNFAQETIEDNLKMIDELGSPNTYNHYAWGWAHAGNTPYRRWKKEIYRGGASDAFVVSWPKGINARGGIRHQYAHAIDMLPTVLDALNIDSPQTIKGATQAPIEGVSMVQSFEDAKAESKHKTQYFEMFGGRSIYHDGWRAVCNWPGPNYTEGAKKGRKLADPISKADLDDLEANGWQLFHVEIDPAEAQDVAADHPEKLKEMIDLWWQEAEKYNVLPIDGTMGQRIGTPRPAISGAREKYVYFPGSPVPFISQPNIYNRSYTITADLNIPAGGAEGVIVSSGSHSGGYTLYLKDNKVHYYYNYLARKDYRITSITDVPEGDVTIVYEFEVTGKPDIRSGKGAPGTGKLFINGEQVGQGVVDLTVPLIFSAEGLSCGWDYADSVDHEGYEPPFRFSGTIKRVTYDLSGEAIQDAEAEMRRAMAKQ